MRGHGEGHSQIVTMRIVLSAIGVAGLIAALAVPGLPPADGNSAAAAAPLPKPKPGVELVASGTTEAPDASTAVEAGTGKLALAGPAETETTGGQPTSPEASASEAIIQELPADVVAMLPRPRPVAVQIPARHSLKEPRPPFGFEPDPQLKAALDAVTEDRYTAAVALSEEFDSLTNKRLIAWLVARAPNSGLTAEQILAVRASHEGWPEPEQLRLRAEQEFLRTRPLAREVVAFFAAESPLTMSGKLAYIRALDGVGRTRTADKELREMWRRERLGASLADRIAQEFGSRLSRADHVGRLHFLLYSRSDEAVSQARRLGSAHVTFARAVLAAYSRRDAKEVDNLLKGVAKQFWNDPAYRLAQARTLRRTGKPIAAARLLAKVTQAEEAAAAHDWWWEERKDLSRQLLDAGQPQLAYEVAGGHAAHSPRALAEAEFHAGWYALRFIDRPLLARPHFERLAKRATFPRTIARGHYWLGRTFEALEDSAAAALAYRSAGQYGATFYGQLAREKLGLTTTGVESYPAPTAKDRLLFRDRELVSVIRGMAASGHVHRTNPFFVQLAETLESPGEVTLTALLARRIGQPRLSNLVGTVAERRGLPVAALRVPLVGVPNVRVPQPASRALLYAVARQESAFNPAAVSHAGARGLMQFMPATAQATARAAGLPYSLDRLTSDPVYNATLGGHHLAELLTNFRGSYVLSFVGYNAGPGRSLQWIRSYGDPRGNQVDAIDWVERIPFDETRDYVQKVMENYQAYRSRLGHPLTITRDLVRGGPQS
jgi:soluble lytic murein transglycosylase